MTRPGTPRIKVGFSSTAWDLAFKQVRAVICDSRPGRTRVELWVNALLSDGDGDGDGDGEHGKPKGVATNVMSLCQARLELTRQLVLLIDERHRVLRRYPVLPALAKSSGWEPEALGPAYLHHLRRDLEAANAPRIGSKRIVGSAVTLSIVEGHSEGP